jgi:hypothetical protein
MEGEDNDSNKSAHPLSETLGQINQQLCDIAADCLRKHTPACPVCSAANLDCNCDFGFCADCQRPFTHDNLYYGRCKPHHRFRTVQEIPCKVCGVAYPYDELMRMVCEKCIASGRFMDNPDKLKGAHTVFNLNHPLGITEMETPRGA